MGTGHSWAQSRAAWSWSLCPYPRCHPPLTLKTRWGADRKFPLNIMPLSMALCSFKCAVSLPSLLGPLNGMFSITNGVLTPGRHRMLGHSSMARNHGFLVGCTFSITGLKYKAWHSVPRPKSHGGLRQARGNLCTLGDFPAMWNLL